MEENVNREYEDFKNLMTTYLSDLEKFVYVITNKNNQIKNEIVQNTCVSALRHWKQLRNIEKLKWWLFSIAKNEAKTYYRKNPCMSEYEDRILFDHSSEVLESLLSDVANLMVKEETNNMVSKSISELSENGQRIILMHYYYDIKLKEVADILNMNYNTVKTIHRRSLEQLKSFIKEKEGALSEEC